MACDPAPVAGFALSAGGESLASSHAIPDMSANAVSSNTRGRGTR
jgi:hypothetical protein